MDNQVCMPSFYFTLLIVVFGIACVWGFYNLLQVLQIKANSPNNPSIWSIIAPTSNQEPTPSTYLPSPIVQQIDPDVADDLALGERPARRRDYRRLYDPLKEPSRRYVNYPGGYPHSAMPGNINIPTQGYLPSYQITGYLTSEKEGPGKMLKLFGRRLDSYKYEYYTTHHKDPSLKIPLEIRGDKELMEGDNVHVPGYQDNYKVALYDLEAPRYIPYV